MGTPTTEEQGEGKEDGVNAKVMHQQPYAESVEEDDQQNLEDSSSALGQDEDPRPNELAQASSSKSPLNQTGDETVDQADTSTFQGDENEIPAPNDKSSQMTNAKADHAVHLGDPSVQADPPPYAEHPQQVNGLLKAFQKRQKAQAVIQPSANNHQVARAPDADQHRKGATSAEIVQQYAKVLIPSKYSY